MLGLRHIELKPGDRECLSEEWNHTVRFSEKARTELKSKLRGKISLEHIMGLQFGLSNPDRERPTSKDILVDDSRLYSRFAEAMKIIKRSANEMSDWTLKDNCQIVYRAIDNTIERIAIILEENGFHRPEHPDFPELEEEINESTQDFLHRDENVTDYPSKELFYDVRNIVIFREMLEMVGRLKQDIGTITK